MRGARLVSENPAGAGLLDHAGDITGTVGGFQRDIGPACLENPKNRRDEGGSLLDEQDHRLVAGP